MMTVFFIIKLRTIYFLYHFIQRSKKNLYLQFCDIKTIWLVISFLQPEVCDILGRLERHTAGRQH